MAGNELGIVQSLGDVYSQEDFDLFFKSVAPYASEALSFKFAF